MLRMLQAVCAVSVALLALSAPSQVVAQKPPPATIRMVPIPIANYTPILVARDKGYFADENLTVTWAPVAQGADGAKCGRLVGTGGRGSHGECVAQRHGGAEEGGGLVGRHVSMVPVRGAGPNYP